MSLFPKKVECSFKSLIFLYHVAITYLDFFFVQSFLIILNSCHLSFQVMEMVMVMATELHRMGVSLMSRVVKVTVVQICA